MHIGQSEVSAVETVNEGCVIDSTRMENRGLKPTMCGKPNRCSTNWKPLCKHKQKVTSRYFAWLVWNRNGTYYADGRGNTPTLGRYSLGAPTLADALTNLEQLDRVKAVEAGKADRSILEPMSRMLSLIEGRRLYEEHIDRPTVTGGTRPATRKRYQAVLDKFLTFANSIGIDDWSQAYGWPKALPRAC